MAQPTKYEKETDFINQTYASSLPALDKEFTNVETSINEIRANLQMFQNDDATGLKSGIIKQDSLDSGIIQYLKGVASQTAGVAETNASNALVVAGNALRDASDAKQQASSANATANDAKNVALGAVEQISESITTVNNAVTELSEYKTETDATLSAYEGRVNSAIAAINPTITNKFGDFTGYTDTNSDGTVTVVEAVKQEVAKQVVERQNLTGDSIATALGYTPANDSSLATVAKTGSYNDLSNVPSTFAPSSHTHTQSQISDFPVLADVATSGSYSDLSNKPTKVSSFTNDAGYLTQHQSLANYLPLSGGTMSGTVVFSTAEIIKRSNNTSYITIRGATSNSDGASLMLSGQGDSDAGAFKLRAGANGGNKALIGNIDGTLQWNGQTIQTTSDARLKTELSIVDDDTLDAWGTVDWGRFKFLSAIKEKGETARYHLGLIAQSVKSAFEAKGLDACRYGILCHEEWNDEFDEDGNLIREAGDMWMVRYEEALAMEAAYQRRRADRIEARLIAIEERLNGEESD